MNNYQKLFKWRLSDFYRVAKVKSCLTFNDRRSDKAICAKFELEKTMLSEKGEKLNLVMKDKFFR